MSPDFWRDLPRLVAALDGDPTCRALVLTGAGKHFTSGMDLATFQDLMGLMQAEPGRAAYALRKVILDLQAALSAMEASRLPVIAAIHGACIGGGVDLVTACDIRLASTDARFSIEEVNIGMAADVGTLQRLPRLIPMGIVQELALTGRRFGAEEAAGWGLVNRVFPDADSLHEGGLALAAEIAAMSPLAVAGTKRAVVYARDHPVADGLDQIATWNGGVLRPEELTKALQARMAKKKADFADLITKIG